METNKEQSFWFRRMKPPLSRGCEKRNGECGNALIYVLIAIALFAALSFTLGRQTDSNEAAVLSGEKAEIYATQLISYAAQAKSVIDQMVFSGTDIDDLDFLDPSEATFNSGTQLDRANRIYHPEGGGLIKGAIPAEAVHLYSGVVKPGWYLARFNNVEWTKSTKDDVILTAYQIKKEVCEKINEKITGSIDIPVLTSTLSNVLIDSTTNEDLMTDPDNAPNCSECHEMSSLCIQNQSQTAYAFYTIVADQ